jgi:hypothetical protein
MVYPLSIAQMRTQFQSSIAAWQHSNSISITEYSLHVVFLVQMPGFTIFCVVRRLPSVCGIATANAGAVVARRL